MLYLKDKKEKDFITRLQIHLTDEQNNDSFNNSQTASINKLQCHINITEEKINDQIEEQFDRSRNKKLKKLTLDDIIAEGENNEAESKSNNVIKNLNFQLAQLYNLQQEKTIQSYKSQEIFNSEKQLLKLWENLFKVQSRQQLETNIIILQSQKQLYPQEAPPQTQSDIDIDDKPCLQKCFLHYKQCGQQVIKGYFKGQVFKICRLGCKQGFLHGLYLVCLFTLLFPISFTIWFPWLLWRFICYIIYKIYKTCCKNNQKSYQNSILKSSNLNLTLAGRILEIYKKFSEQIKKDLQT